MAYESQVRLTAESHVFTPPENPASDKLIPAIVAYIESQQSAVEEANLKSLFKETVASDNLKLIPYAIQTSKDLVSETELQSITEILA